MCEDRITSNENVLLSTFLLNKTDNIIAIREHLMADGNFVLTYLLKWILNEQNSKLCLVNFRHTLIHYHSIGKRLAFDVTSKIKTGDIETIEPMVLVVNSLREKSQIDSNFAKFLFLKIKSCVERLRESAATTYLIIDDVSHLLDMSVSLENVVAFINCCCNLPVKVIILSHVSDSEDKIVGNALCHIADVYFDVFSLKTGFSKDVTGILKFKRRKNGVQKQEVTYHYKAMETEVKIFLPGEAMQLFYK